FPVRPVTYSSGDGKKQSGECCWGVASVRASSVPDDRREQKRTKPPGPEEPGGFCSSRAVRSGLVVSEEPARQRARAGARQVGGGVDQSVAGGRDAEHGGERRRRGATGRDRSGWPAGLRDRPARRAAEAAEGVTVHVALARAEVPCRVRLAGCARGERREAHLDHTDM